MGYTEHKFNRLVSAVVWYRVLTTQVGAVRLSGIPVAVHRTSPQFRRAP